MRRTFTGQAMEVMFLNWQEIMVLQEFMSYMAMMTGQFR